MELTGRGYDVSKELAMSMSSLEEIERAIEELEPQDFDELCAWLDHREHAFDARIKVDLTEGRLDDFVKQALREERSDLVRRER